ncbi:MAG: methyltransferase domain-containing protein [Gammaproteobacteria bacterium]|nr:methyltransferase domain-containing protein [Gammaproteobacteria bacterium]
MDRIPEPELMDEVEQACAYAAGDFSEPHQAFVEHFRQRFADYNPGQVLDLGCGPADISIRFARAYPQCRLTGVDGAAAMLALGREAVSAGGLQSRVELIQVYLPGPLPRAGTFDTVISNSLLHHLAEPMVLWDTLKANASERAMVFVMDLLRPDSQPAALELVERYASDEIEMLKRDFFHSLLAAYCPEEVGVQLHQAGLADHLQLELVSDRHFIVWGRLQ